MTELFSIYSGLGNQRMEDVGIWSFVFVILFSLAASFVFSFLYVHFFEKRATGSQINRAFPLLSIAITVIFITVQFSLPLSLGLLGALSIVRFRTPIKEPEEIGFIMLVVASSLSCATFNLVFPVILAVIAFCALYLIDTYALLGGKKINGGMLAVTGPNDDKTKHVLQRIEKELLVLFPRVSLHSVSKSETFTATFVFNKVNTDKVMELISELLESYPNYQFNLMTNRSTVL